MNSQLSSATYRRGALADLAELQRMSVGRARWQSIWGASAAALRSINRHAATLAGGGLTQNAEQQQQRPREHRARRSQRSSSRGDPDPLPKPLEVVPLAREAVR
jgi:hypothetical protein